MVEESRSLSFFYGSRGGRSIESIHSLDGWALQELREHEGSQTTRRSSKQNDSWYSIFTVSIKFIKDTISGTVQANGILLDHHVDGLLVLFSEVYGLTCSMFVDKSLESSGKEFNGGAFEDNIGRDAWGSFLNVGV